MRYLLVVGFYCQVYKKEPLSRIFVNNQLIDEFTVPLFNHDFPNRITFFKDKHILQPYPTSESDNNFFNTMPQIKFYELDVDDSITDLNLKIKILNNDNNHSNGFLSSSTVIQLRVCSFFPLDQKLINRLYIRNKKFFLRNFAWCYKAKKNSFFDLLLNGMKWQGENGQIFETRSTDYRGLPAVGGNGFFTCDLIKKYWFFIPKLSKSYKFTFPMFYINHFLNKYNQHHEDQRNNN